MKNYLFTALLLLLLPGIVIAGDSLKVTRVIDGDTFELENGDRVRLIGVDTPETVHPSKPVEYYGKEATEFTRKLIEGKTVCLEYDQQKRDRYNRILSYVFVEADSSVGDPLGLLEELQPHKKVFLNALLIKWGYAHAYLKYPFKQEYMDYFRLLEREAREAGRGLWAEDRTPPKTPAETPAGTYWLNSKSNTLHNSSCRWYANTKAGYYTQEILGKDCGICGGAKRPAVIQEPQKPQAGDVTVYVTKTGSKYHRLGCRYLKKSCIPMNLSDAKRRYGPCSVCKPPR